MSSVLTKILLFFNEIHGIKFAPKSFGAQFFSEGECEMKKLLLVTAMALLVTGTSYVLAGGLGRNGKRSNRPCTMTGSGKAGSIAVNRKGNCQRQKLRDGSGAGSQTQYKGANGKKGQNNAKGQKLSDGSCVVSQNNFKGTTGKINSNNLRGQRLRDGSCVVPQKNYKTVNGKNNPNNTQGQKPKNASVNTTSSTDK